LQEQDEDFSNPHSICREIALPRASIDEHSIQNVHQEIWYFSPLSLPWRESARMYERRKRRAGEGFIAFAYSWRLVRRMNDATKGTDVFAYWIANMIQKPYHARRVRYWARFRCAACIIFRFRQRDEENEEI